MVFPNLPGPCLLPDSLSPSLSFIMFLGLRPGVACSSSPPKHCRKSARLPAARVEAATWQGGGGGQAAGWGRHRSPARARVPTHGQGPTGHRGQRPSPDAGPGPGRGPSAGHGLGKSRALRPGSGHRLTPGAPSSTPPWRTGPFVPSSLSPGLASGPLHLDQLT